MKLNTWLKENKIQHIKIGNMTTIIINDNIYILNIYGKIREFKYTIYDKENNIYIDKILHNEKDDTIINILKQAKGN